MCACVSPNVSVVITLNVTLYVVDFGSYFEKRWLYRTVEFKAEASVTFV